MKNILVARFGVVVVLGASALGCRTSQTVALDRPVPRVDAEEAPPMTAPNAATPTKALTTYTKPSVDELKRKLTPVQFQVTQNEATEPPFRNEFWDSHAAGIYVDVATGEPLFSSVDKFESGTGWPSFSRPIENGRVVSKTDSTLGMVRVEVRSKAGDSHLGHVFDDGPAPTGERYCINSASLRFVPANRLAAEGYGGYASRFAGGTAQPLPASTTNSCAAPAPGERPGCEATLDTTTVAGGAAAKSALSALPGVLEVEDDAVKGKLRVIFDPKVVTGEQLTRLASTRP